VFLVFASCTTNNTKTKDNNEVYLDVVLSINDLFSGDKVFEFLKNKKRNIIQAKKTFLKGIDLYKNKRDFEEAEKSLINSILQDPSSIAYYELGNVYLDKKQYDVAIKAYGMAEQIGYEPFSKILYNMSCAYSLSEKTDLAGQYLEYAIQAGYSNVEQIEKDSDLANLRSDTYTFESHLKKGLEGMSNSDNLFWLQFKQQFPKASLPLKLDPFLDKTLIGKLGSISYDFEKYVAEMRDDEFSREVSKSFHYYLNLKETEKFVALIYIVKDEYMGELSPVLYRLVTFTHKGELIDKKEIAGRSTLSLPLKVVSINDKLNLKIDNYTIVYEKDPDEFGFDENPITSREKISTDNFSVSSDGKINKYTTKALAKI
jgi:hypothetical protein